MKSFAVCEKAHFEFISREVGIMNIAYEIKSLKRNQRVSKQKPLCEIIVIKYTKESMEENF